MKTKIIALLLIFFSVSCHSQTDIKYNINNVGYIYISPKMELQSGDYKEIADQIKKTFNVYGDRIIFQQKGINELSSTANNFYVRAIIETKFGEMGDFQMLHSPIDFTTSELQELSLYYKKQTIDQFRNTLLKLILWHGVGVERINNQYCIKYSYVRQLDDNPPVFVSSYIFQNYDRCHTITLSYRIKEENIWKNLLLQSLNSFKIENRFQIK